MAAKDTITVFDQQGQPRELEVVAGQALGIVHGARLRCVAAQQPHLFVPEGLAGLQVEFPGAQAGPARGPRP